MLKLNIHEIPWKSPFDVIAKKAEKLKRLHRLLIFFGAIALIGGGFAFLIYMPKAEAISQKEKEISALEDKIRMGKIKAKNLPAMKEKKAEIDKKLVAALELLPDEREIPSLLKGNYGAGNRGRPGIQAVRSRAGSGEGFLCGDPGDH